MAYLDIIWRVPIKLSESSISELENRFHQRKLRLANYCKQFEDGTSIKYEIEDDETSEFFLLDATDQRGILTCAAPKAGSSYMRQMLPWLSSNFLKKQLKRLQYSELDLVRNDDFYLKILPIRHPVNRILSGWDEKFAVHCHNHNKCHPFVNHLRFFKLRL